uniref:Endoplasmic reticulum-Golgi intermediate compartment protein 3 n=1 Tax=Hirondellea gigas TaxID=1518452 RepID=A0A6A7G9S0_9CRUS
MAEMFERFKRLDVFRQIPKDLTNPSGAGAAVSVICIMVVGSLFLAEFIKFMTITTVSSMFVETPENLLSEEKLQIHIDIEVPELPCAVISLDAQDIMGSHSVDVGGTLEKYRMDTNGNRMFDKLGRPLASGPGHGQSIVRDQIGEGCRLKGFLLVNKVPGNAHISAHAHPELLQTLLGGKPMNLSHKINYLSFGSIIKVKGVDLASTPLNGMQRISRESYGEIHHQGHSHKIEQTGSYEYYLKIVPTIYETLSGTKLRTYQFTSSANHIQAQTFPAIYFRYDFSPITVQFSQISEPFTTFVVEVFAIIGGVFTGFSIVSVWLNLGVDKIMKRKAAIGKLG